MTPMSAEQLAQALDAKPAGRNKWKARCVAHEDRNPSLWISEAANGKTLVKCWAGCSQSEVIEALRGQGLWGAARKSAIAFMPRPKPIDDRELRWIVDDIYLLDREPRAINVWTFLQQAAEISPFALDVVSRALMKRRPPSRPFVLRWMNEYIAPVTEQATEVAA